MSDFDKNYASTVQRLVAINHQMSVNSVNACISYNGFSEFTPKQGIHFKDRADVTLNVRMCKH